MQFAIGIDIGGTNMSAAVVDTAAQVVSYATTPTLAAQGSDDGMQRLGDLVARVLDEAKLTTGDVCGIGIGCTGPVNSVTGRIHNPFTLPTWDDVPVCEAMTTRFQLPSLLLNDAHAAALGEHSAGAGRGTEHMIYMTVSTGIGSGMILNGRLYLGAGLLSGEVGHQALDFNGPECYCGGRGCLEMLAAAPAIAAAAQQDAQDDSVILRLSGERAAITAKHVGEAASAGDTFARGLLARTGFYLGVGIANLLNIITPEMVVLGGGVMQSWDYIVPTMQETIAARSGLLSGLIFRYERARLGLRAGVIGAAKQAFDKYAGIN